MDADAKQAIDALQEQVRELEDRISDLEDTGGGSVVGGGDNYDQYVLNQIEERYPDGIKQRTIPNLYKEAGVRDMSKIKDRIQLLKQTGKLQGSLK